MVPRLNYSLPEPLRDCGVVWGSGELAFTGEAGTGPLSLEAQWQAGVAQVNQQGPLATDLMRLLTGAQGTMGVVVWASIKCELLPGARKCVAVTAPKLESLVDFCCRIERFRLGDEVLILNRRQFAAALGKCAGGASRSGLPEWSVLIGLAGTALYPQEKVDVQEHEFEAAARQFGLELQESVEGASNAEIMSCLESLSPTPHWKLAAKGGCQDVFFLTTLDKVPQFVRTVEDSDRPARLSCLRHRRLRSTAAPGRVAARGIQFPVRPGQPERSRNRQGSLFRGEPDPDRAGRIFFAPVRALGGPGLQPRRHCQPRAADGKANRRSQAGIEPRKALLLKPGRGELVYGPGT